VASFVQLHLFDSPVYEQSIYLGYALLVLAVVAVLPARRWSRLPDRARFARCLFLSGFVAGLLIIAGPYIPLNPSVSYWQLWATPGATVHVPSLDLLMFDLAPVFRFFVRAFVLVSACLAVLAAIGFSRLERTPWMTTVRRGALAALVLVLVGLEFTNAPPHTWFSARIPPWVAAVRQLPPDASLVEYPIAPAFSPRSLYYMFWQTKFDRPDTNPAVDPQALALAAEVAQPNDPATGAALHRAGIDYAVVHTKLPPQTTPPYQPALPDDSEPRDAGAENPWFQLVTKTPDAMIYRIRSRPKAVRSRTAEAGR
jgi:hypothetical protein